jgi:AcrR family transcriptional regulator
MEDIAAAAGVSVGTLYNYFGTKNTVLLAHVGSQVAEMTEAGEDVLAGPPPDIVPAVQSLVSIYLDRFIDLEPDLLREVFAAGFGTSLEMLPELIRLDELLADQLGRLIGPFAEAGQLAAEIEVDEAVIVLYSLLVTQLIMYVSVESMTATTLRRAVARQIEMAFSGLRAQGR